MNMKKSTNVKNTPKEETNAYLTVEDFETIYRDYIEEVYDLHDQFPNNYKFTDIIIDTLSDFRERVIYELSYKGNNGVQKSRR